MDILGCPYFFCIHLFIFFNISIKQYKHHIAYIYEINIAFIKYKALFTTIFLFH